MIAPPPRRICDDTCTRRHGTPRLDGASARTRRGTSFGHARVPARSCGTRTHAGNTFAVRAKPNWRALGRPRGGQSRSAVPTPEGVASQTSLRASQPTGSGHPKTTESFLRIPNGGARHGPESSHGSRRQGADALLGLAGRPNSRSSVETCGAERTSTGLVGFGTSAKGPVATAATVCKKLQVLTAAAAFLRKDPRGPGLSFCTLVPRPRQTRAAGVRKST